MMPQRDETWLHSMVESVDHRLELLNTKLDSAMIAMMTKDYCTKECEVRRNAIDKRYFLGWGSCMLLMMAAIGLALKFA